MGTRPLNFWHFMLGIVAVALLSLFTVWLMWLAWGFVLTSVWPDGPTTLTDPDFLVFAAGYYLLLMIKAVVFWRPR
jgi:uncharacterized membrane protein